MKGRAEGIVIFSWVSNDDMFELGQLVEEEKKSLSNRLRSSANSLHISKPDDNMDTTVLMLGF